MDINVNIRHLERYLVERVHLYIMLLSLIIRVLIMRKYDYQDSIGFIVKSTAKAFESAFDQKLRRKTDITVTQSRVIGTLALVKDGMTQKEIASTIRIEAPTIAQNVAGLYLKSSDQIESRGEKTTRSRSERSSSFCIMENKGGSE